VVHRSYVVYAPTRWSTPWQPAQNLAHALAARHAVLYVDPVMSPITPFRYGLHRESWRGVRAVLERGLRADERLRVFTPVALPPVSHPRARALSGPLVRTQLRRAVARAALDPPVVLSWWPLGDVAGAAAEALRVAFVMDHPAAGALLLGRDPDELEREAQTSCASADLLCTTSSAMQQFLSERGWEPELIRFGFPRDLAGAYDSAPEPVEYGTLPRPLLGYTGGIDDRLDFRLVVELADRFREGSIAFVGAVSPRLPAQARAALESRPNIHLLGPRPRQQLPAYVRHLDVALMPYRDCLFTRYQSPMKVWEYLYAGPPIVGAGSPDLCQFAPALVSYAHDPGAFGPLVEAALTAPSAGRDARRRYALANTWDHRAEQLESLIEARLGQPASARTRK
jgi:teichuronic acid biosynthesis glycosyltransferase TuaH